MSSPAILAMTRIMEALPESTQERIVDLLQEYLLEIEDDLEWDALFQRMRPQLAAAGERAREEIVQGETQPLDYDQL